MDGFTMFFPNSGKHDLGLLAELPGAVVSLYGWCPPIRSWCFGGVAAVIW